jgi:rRNA maturation RNase YbeY
MSTINFIAKKIAMPTLDEEKVKAWIVEVARRHDRRVGDLTYIFCDDEKILEVNIEFLQHNYYTDIITFDYSTKRRISGDMFISLDTVASNADLFGCEYDEEFMRVVIHGVLHLCGINDKGEGEREIMEQHENDALALWKNDISKL